MRFGRITTGMAVAFSCLLVSSVTLANDRQLASPVWGIDDAFDSDGGAGAYHILGLDFDPETPGVELPEASLYACELESAGSGMIKVKHTIKLRFRSTIDGTISYTTDKIRLRSQAFPDPFDVLNQGESGRLIYAYVRNFFDVTNQLQQAVTGGADPTDTLCDNNEFPGFSLFGLNMATTQLQASARGTQGAEGVTEHALVFACALTGGYALKQDPADFGWDGSPLEAIGVQQYTTFEATPGAEDKGALLVTKTFNEQDEDDDATPGWAVDFELSFVGDIRGTGSDVIRIVDRQPDEDPERVERRTKHYDIRTGDLVGSVVRDTPLD